MGNNESVANTVRQSLDASIENLDPTIRRRLNQARIAAAANHNKPKLPWRIASAVSFALIVAFSWNFIPQQAGEQTPLVTEVLEEDLDMLDDLEFIVWISEDQDDVSL